MPMGMPMTRMMRQRILMGCSNMRSSSITTIMSGRRWTRTTRIMMSHVSQEGGLLLSSSSSSITAPANAATSGCTSTGFSSLSPSSPHSSSSSSSLSAPSCSSSTSRRRHRRHSKKYVSSSTSASSGCRTPCSGINSMRDKQSGEGKEDFGPPSREEEGGEGPRSLVRHGHGHMHNGRRKNKKTGSSTSRTRRIRNERKAALCHVLDRLFIQKYPHICFPSHPMDLLGGEEKESWWHARSEEERVKGSERGAGGGAAPRNNGSQIGLSFSSLGPAPAPAPPAPLPSMWVASPKGGKWVVSWVLKRWSGNHAPTHTSTSSTSTTQPVRRRRRAPPSLPEEDEEETKKVQQKEEEVCRREKGKPPKKVSPLSLQEIGRAALREVLCPPPTSFALPSLSGFNPPPPSSLPPPPPPSACSGGVSGTVRLEVREALKQVEERRENRRARERKEKETSEGVEHEPGRCGGSSSLISFSQGGVDICVIIPPFSSFSFSSSFSSLLSSSGCRVWCLPGSLTAFAAELRLRQLRKRSPRVAAEFFSHSTVEDFFFLEGRKEEQQQIIGGGAPLSLVPRPHPFSADEEAMLSPSSSSSSHQIVLNREREELWRLLGVESPQSVQVFIVEVRGDEQEAEEQMEEEGRMRWEGNPGLGGMGSGEGGKREVQSSLASSSSSSSSFSSSSSPFSSTPPLQSAFRLNESSSYPMPSESNTAGAASKSIGRRSEVRSAEHRWLAPSTRDALLIASHMVGGGGGGGGLEEDHHSSRTGILLFQFHTTSSLLRHGRETDDCEHHHQYHGSGGGGGRRRNRSGSWRKREGGPPSPLPSPSSSFPPSLPRTFSSLHSSDLLEEMRARYAVVHPGRTPCGMLSFLFLSGPATSGGGRFSSSSSLWWPHYLLSPPALLPLPSPSHVSSSSGDPGATTTTRSSRSSAIFSRRGERRGRKGVKQQQDQGRCSRSDATSRWDNHRHHFSSFPASTPTTITPHSSKPWKELLHRRAALHRAQQGRFGLPKHFRPVNTRSGLSGSPRRRRSQGWGMDGLSFSPSSSPFSSTFVSPSGAGVVSGPSSSSSMLFVPRLLPHFMTARYLPEDPEGGEGGGGDDGGVDSSSTGNQSQEWTGRWQGRRKSSSAGREGEGEAFERKKMGGGGGGEIIISPLSPPDAVSTSSTTSACASSRFPHSAAKAYRDARAAAAARREASWEEREAAFQDLSIDMVVKQSFNRQRDD